MMLSSLLRARHCGQINRKDNELLYLLHVPAVPAKTSRRCKEHNQVLSIATGGNKAAVEVLLNSLCKPWCGAG
jgi:hypothetical protein